MTRAELGLEVVQISSASSRAIFSTIQSATSERAGQYFWRPRLRTLQISVKSKEPTRWQGNHQAL